VDQGDVPLERPVGGRGRVAKVIVDGGERGYVVDERRRPPGLPGKLSAGLDSLFQDLALVIARLALGVIGRHAIGSLAGHDPDQRVLGIARHDERLVLGILRPGEQDLGIEDVGQPGPLVVRSAVAVVAVFFRWAG